MVETKHTPWTMDIKYGPDGEDNYAWVHCGPEVIGTFKTHRAKQVVEAVNSFRALKEENDEFYARGYGLRCMLVDFLNAAIDKDELRARFSDWDFGCSGTKFSVSPAQREEFARSALSFDPASLKDEMAAKDERIARFEKALKAVYHWADSKCPCHHETPNPCPLCGASVENLEACKSVESIFPRDILRDVQSALRDTGSERT